jgi:Arc/MetJ family transcription regulator
MRTTLNIDDEMLAKASELTGIREKTTLLHEGLKALISQESAKRLAKLGGSSPKIKDMLRR